MLEKGPFMWQTASLWSRPSQLLRVQVLRSGQWRCIPGEMLLPGDVFSVIHPHSTATSKHEGEAVVPADALLICGLCITDEAVLTGESTPQWKEPIAGEPEQEVTVTFLNKYPIVGILRLFIRLFIYLIAGIIGLFIRLFIYPMDGMRPAHHAPYMLCSQQPSLVLASLCHQQVLPGPGGTMFLKGLDILLKRSALGFR
jgi:magnesium-transporting ATPase (P-type)